MTVLRVRRRRELAQLAAAGWQVTSRLGVLRPVDPAGDASAACEPDASGSAGPAIRRDERVVIAFGLDRDEVGDPDYLDPIAVSLACAGEPVRLTRAERRAARARLAAAGLGPTEIGRRLSRRGTAARPPLPDVGRAAA